MVNIYFLMLFFFTITLSKDFIAIFNKDINVFKNYNFNILLRFENLYTRNFFMLITKKNIFNNFIDLNLDDLKITRNRE